MRIGLGFEIDFESEIVALKLLYRLAGQRGRGVEGSPP